MQDLPAELQAAFERRLDRARIPLSSRPAYHKWIKFYLFFCQKFGYPATAPAALGPFLTKLTDKSYSIDDRHHAATAVRLLLRHQPEDHHLYLQLSAPVPLVEAPLGATASPAPPATLTVSWEKEFRLKQL